MAAANEPAATTTTGSEFVLKRTLAAPRALVWKVWTEPEHLLQWFSPAGMTMASCTMDLRSGGSFLYCLRMPDGSDMWAKWVFREVVAPARLVWVHGFSDAAGKRNHHPIAPTWPLEMICTLSFEERGDQTELTLHKVTHNANATEQLTFDSSHASMQMGWGGTLQQLDAHLAVLQGTRGERDFFITRVLDAPPALVWQAWTEPNRMARWWGPNNFTNPVCEMDLRPGGAYRLVMRSPDGEDYPITGEVREVVAPALLVMTLDCAEHPAEWHEAVRAGSGRVGPNPAGTMVQTVRFEDLGGKTRLSISTRFESTAIRDAMVKMGMHEGWSQSLGRLAQHVEAG